MFEIKPALQLGERRFTTGDTCNLGSIIENEGAFVKLFACK